LDGVDFAFRARVPHAHPVRRGERSCRQRCGRGRCVSTTDVRQL